MCIIIFLFFLVILWRKKIKEVFFNFWSQKSFMFHIILKADKEYWILALYKEDSNFPELSINHSFTQEARIKTQWLITLKKEPFFFLFLFLNRSMTPYCEEPPSKTYVPNIPSPIPPVPPPSPPLTNPSWATSNSCLKPTCKYPQKIKKIKKMELLSSHIDSWCRPSNSEP